MFCIWHVLEPARHLRVAQFHLGFKCSAAGFLVQFHLLLYFITLIFQWRRDCPLTLQGITPPDSELESILPIHPMAVRRPYAITV